MDIGHAQAGNLIAIDLLQEALRGLQRTGAIPSTFTGTNQGTNFTTTIASLDFEMAKPSGLPPYTRLHLVGSVVLANSGLALPLDTWVRMDPVLQPGPNFPVDAPVLVLQYTSVDVAPAPPLTAPMVDAMFRTGPAANVFASFTLPILDALIASVGGALFPDPSDPPPASGLWEATAALMPAASSDDTATDALGVFIDLPGGDATPSDTESVLPSLTEFGVVFARAFLDVVLANQIMTGTQDDGTEVTEMSLVMGDEELLIDGRATKDLAEINFSGPLALRLARGSNRFIVDTRAVEVNVDLPWWADLFLFMTGPGGFLSFGLIPIFGGLILEASTGSSVSDVRSDIFVAPFAVRGVIGQALSDGLIQISSSLSNIGPLGTLRPASTPESSLVDNGHIAVFAQVFVNPLTEEIADGVYSRAASRIVELQLESGRWFAASELARIVDLGLITTPGYRAVAPHFRGDTPVRGYMQDEPDLAKQDNLLERFRP